MSELHIEIIEESVEKELEPLTEEEKHQAKKLLDSIDFKFGENIEFITDQK